MKICSPICCPSPEDILFLTVLKKFIVGNYSFSDSTGIYFFKFRNNDTRINCKICPKFTTDAPYIILVSLLLNLNIFDLILVFFAEFEHLNVGWSTLLT